MSRYTFPAGAVTITMPDGRPLIGLKSISYATALPWVWWWRSRLPERKGQRCEVLARGRMNSALVRFADGYQVITSRYAVRKAPG